MTLRSTFGDLLRETRKRHGGRITRCNMYDPNVCTSVIDLDDELNSKAVPADRFVQQLKFRYGGRPITIYASDEHLSVRLRAEFGMAFGFSVNRIDWILPAQLPAPDWPLTRWPAYVFGDGSFPSGLTIPWKPSLLHTVERLELSADESIHVYGNGITVYTSSTSSARLEAVLSGVTAIADALPAAQEETVDYGELPAVFHSLIDLLEKWDETDDDERSERLARASRAELRQLVAAVEPHFESINRYLDGFGETPLPESAIALGALAEAASEAQLLLE